MAICGFYVHGLQGPSFFQRMFSNAYDLDSNNYGIESFLLGRWVGGAPNNGLGTGDHGYPATDTYSRLDWEFYQDALGGAGLTSEPIKGMPGCKDNVMCSEISTPPNNASLWGVGHFQLTQTSAAEFNMTSIWCSSNLQDPCGNLP
jgi:hypothetical protein